MYKRRDVVHISPINYGAGGTYGGGERYPLELARAMSATRPTKLVCFGTKYERQLLGNLQIVVLPTRLNLRKNALNPLSERLVTELAQAKVVHVHQWESVLSNLTTIISRTLGKSVFITDHGGSTKNYWRELRLHRLVDHLLAVSEFSRSFYPEFKRSSVIGGGVDLNKYAAGSSNPQDRLQEVLFVGRQLPHKGIDHLIAALPADVRLRVVGRSHDSSYTKRLHQLAENKNVLFHEDVGDKELVGFYQRARAVILPSQLEPAHGAPAPKAELLGLTLLEAMACGTPAVCTRVGGMPEVVSHQKTGFVVPADDSDSLASSIKQLLSDDRAWARMSRAARTSVETEWNWPSVARKCELAYSQVAL